MTIALLTDGIYPNTLGGIQMHSYKLAKHLCQLKIKVDVYTSDDFDHLQPSDYYTKKELDLISFRHIQKIKSRYFPGHYLWRSYIFSKELYTSVNQKKYDAIYAQGFTGWYACQTKLNSKLVTNLHGLEMFQHAINAKNKLEHCLLRIPAKTIIKNSIKQISLGGKLTNILIKQGAKETNVFEIPNAIGDDWLNEEAALSEKQLNENNRPIRFIFIGRYERRKAIEEINKVVIELFKQGYRFECHFIGPIPLNKQIHNNDLTSYVSSDLTTYLPNKLIHYHGKIMDQQIIKQQLQDADILLCPSYSEGMPTVILEAMACKCAVIATDVGASGELVNSDNGWLIKGDIVDGITKTIKEAVSLNLGTLKHMQSKSYTKVKGQYTWDKIAKKTITVLTNKY